MHDELVRARSRQWVIKLGKSESNYLLKAYSHLHCARNTSPLTKLRPSIVRGEEGVGDGSKHQSR